MRCKQKRLIVGVFCVISLFFVFFYNSSQKLQQQVKYESLPTEEPNTQIQYPKNTIPLVETKPEPQVEGLSNESNSFKLEAHYHLNPASRDLNHVMKNEQLLNNKTVLPVVVISCNRPSVRRCLDSLLKYRPSAEQFPIIVSQDCGHGSSADVIRSYGPQITYIQHPDLSEPDVPPGDLHVKGYYKIARHYRWAMDHIFRKMNHVAVIIVEDDLEVAPDFYSYFSSSYKLLLKDPTLWCVSAWNDNGKANLIDMSQQGSGILYRSDFFPGLGWMMTKQLWDEIEPKWPRSYWDDWMRLPEQRKNRACIRPEISRTITFGRIGVSNGLFFDKHIKSVKLNRNPVDFERRNLSYLIETTYDRQFVPMVYSLPEVTANDVLTNSSLTESGPLRITYHTKDAFKNIARLFGLMSDFKSGVPRTAYHGILPLFYKGRRVYIAPNANWKSYDPT